MRIHKPLLVAALALALAGGAAAIAPAPAASAFVATMIEVEGEGAKYWPRWRGPSGQGIVREGTYSDKWGPADRIKWKVPVPGRGHSSPIVWGNRIFVTTAYDEGARLSLLAFDRSTGKQLWETFVPVKQGPEHVYPKNSRASATAVTDGSLVYASFGTHGLMAVDFNGKVAWHNPIGRLANTHGSAGSPILYKDRLFIYQDHQGTEETGAYVAAFDRKTGRQIWKTDRVETVGWGTPIVIDAGDHDELIVSSQRKVYGYDPGTGKVLWTVTGLGFEVIPTPVVADGLEDVLLEVELQHLEDLDGLLLRDLLEEERAGVGGKAGHQVGQVLRGQGGADGFQLLGIADLQGVLQLGVEELDLELVPRHQAQK